MGRAGRYQVVVSGFVVEEEEGVEEERSLGGNPRMEPSMYVTPAAIRGVEIARDRAGEMAFRSRYTSFFPLGATAATFWPRARASEGGTMERKMSACAIMSSNSRSWIWRDVALSLVAVLRPERQVRRG